MAAGYRSPLWILGIAKGGVTPPAAGQRSMLAPWLGGASAPSSAPPVTLAGYSSLMAFWLGGAAQGDAPFPYGKYSRQVLEAKPAAEIVATLIDFTSQLLAAETIAAVQIECVLVSGTVDDSATLITASPSFSSRQVRQLLAGGTNGQMYCLKCTVRSTLLNYYTITAYLAVTSSIH